MKRLFFLLALAALALPASLAAEDTANGWVEPESLLSTAQSSEDDEDADDDDESPDPNWNHPSTLPDPFGYTGDAADCITSCGVELDRCTASCASNDAACNRSCVRGFGSCKRSCGNMGYSATCKYVPVGRILITICPF